MSFQRSDGDVDTMVQPMLETTLAEGDGWQAARLPYAGRNLAMTLVLPDPHRMREVEAALTSGGLGDVLTVGRPATLDVRLPKWTSRHKHHWTTCCSS